MKPRALRCLGCGGAFLATSAHAVAHCSPGCRARRQERLAAARARLVGEGFVEHGEAPNVYVRGGYAITIEEAVVSLESALAKYHRWAEHHAG